MNQVRVILNKLNKYTSSESDFHIMEVLANFFTIDVNGDINYCMKRFNEKNDALFYVGGDWASLEKDENGYVVMIDTTTWRIYEDKPIPEEMILRIKPDELIKLLYKWEELYARKVPEIMIIKDGDKFEMFEVKS
jgi:hypothetical protein